MAYDVTLVQFNGNIGGMTTFSLAGVPQGTFDYLLCSFWVCLQGGGTTSCDIGPGTEFFDIVPSSGGNASIQLSLSDLATLPHSTIFNGTYAYSPLTGIRSNVLLSVNCQTQTVQVYVNDAPLTLTSGGWLKQGQMGQFGGLAFVDIGSFSVFPAMADLWWNVPIAFYDLSIAANRRKFINADLTPVDLGAHGTEPTGNSPLVYCTVPSGGVPNDFLTNYGTGGSFIKDADITLTLQTPGTCRLPPSVFVPITGVSATGEVGDLAGNHELKLVSLYPMSAASGNVYSFENSNGADFPSSFNQFSLSVWCCEDVNIRGPDGINADYRFNMDFKPASANLTFKDASGATLFSGTFTNPGTVNNLYHVMFSIDTSAQTYTFWVSSGGPAIQWSSTNATFGNAGSISNAIGTRAPVGMQTTSGVGTLTVVTTGGA